MNLDPVPPVALVVDDEPVTRLMVKRALESLGCAPEVMAHLHGSAPAAADRDDVTILLIDAHCSRN
jgi:CheY-like chemotaxis protein